MHTSGFNQKRLTSYQEMLTLAIPRIPKGEWILVTGADGYIASHIVDVLLEEGYNVQGSVRSEQPWLEHFFISKHGSGRFKTAIITDLTDKDGFDRATCGMSGVIHTVLLTNWTLGRAEWHKTKNSFPLSHRQAFYLSAQMSTRLSLVL
jgi:hypothetical protein